MFEGIVELLDELDGAFDTLLEADLSWLDAATLLGVTRRWDRLSRRAGAVGHRLVADIDQRHLAVEHGHRNSASLLRALCNVTPYRARRAVALARDLAPGRTLTGQPLPAVFARTAAAQAAGELSVEHAQLIITTIDRLPDPVAATYDTTVEADLVTAAADADPAELARLARRISDHLDPDGTLRGETYRDKHRSLTVAQRPDGSAHLDGELTAPCAEALLTVLDSLAAPAPAESGAVDPRTATERRHDGLLDALLRLLRDGGLPATGGVHATILLTITEAELQARTGLATTGHGALISVEQALTIATDAQTIPVVFDTAQAISAYGSTHRTATRTQRYALAARDVGCSFPGCDVPPAWTETHHVKQFQHGGPTALDNLTLLCGFHHREHQKLGWTCA